MNYNLKIALTKIKGSRLEFLPDENGNGSIEYICLPVNNAQGTIVNGGADSWGFAKCWENTYLCLEAIEVRDQDRGTHILVGAVTKEILERNTEEQLRKQRPILGNLVPWVRKKNGAGK